MKKSMLYCGVVYVLIGCLFLICAITLDTRINTLLAGFAGTCFGPGLLMIGKYLYWSHPNNAARYVEKTEVEKIELHDERKEMLRNKTGRIVVLINLVLSSLAIILFSLLGMLEAINFAKPIVLTLAVFFVLQLGLSSLVFNVLQKRH